MVDKLLNIFGNLVKGTINGFDKLIFKDPLKPIIFAGGMQSLLYNKNIPGWDSTYRYDDKTYEDITIVVECSIKGTNALSRFDTIISDIAVEIVYMEMVLL